jgi:chromate transporter
VHLLLDLFLTFVKIGLFTFGGGYAMISMIEGICVEKKGWITHEEMMDITVIAESTPGPIAINCATYVGYKQGGLLGSVLTTLGVVLPSFVIIYLISTALEPVMQIPLVVNAFRGIRIGVGVVILRVAVQMVKKMQKKPFPRIVAGCACAVVLAANFLAVRLSSIVLMVAAGLVSLGVFFAKKGGEGK